MLAKMMERNVPLIVGVKRKSDFTKKVIDI